MPTPDSADAAASGPAQAPALSVVVVTHNSAAQIAHTLPAIVAELRAGDELIVADNLSTDAGAELARRLAPGAHVIERGVNDGFGAGANAGAGLASNELLLFLNPDALVAPGFRDAIELPIVEARGWQAWQGLLTAADETLVNTWGGAIHFTGIAWAGGAERPLSEAPAEPQQVPFASGGCLAILRQSFEEVGGFDPTYFLYHEDADLSLRLRLAGGSVGLEPRARADHDYEFSKGAHKWRYLEQNRWATIIRTYPATLLVLLAPALAATELALLLVATLGGWLPEKLNASAATLAALPRLLRERRLIRRGAEGWGPGSQISAADFGAQLTPSLDSEYLGRAADSALLEAVLGGYWAVVKAVLGPPSS